VEAAETPPSPALVAAAAPAPFDFPFVSLRLLLFSCIIRVNSFWLLLWGSSLPGWDIILSGPVWIPVKPADITHKKHEQKLLIHRAVTQPNSKQVPPPETIAFMPFMPPLFTCSIARHGTAQHSAAQHSTAQHSTAQHSTAQYGTAWHSTARHGTA
jgi:hypothetical protein